MKSRKKMLYHVKEKENAIHHRLKKFSLPYFYAHLKYKKHR